MNERLRRIIAFLKEYKALCEKHGLFVDSCGHCNSPWIVGVGVGPYAQRLEAGIDVPAVEVARTHVSHLVEQLYDDSGEEQLDEASRDLILEALGLK